MIDESQRRAANVLAITSLLTFAVITVAFTRFMAPLLVWNDITETARNIAAHQTTFRIYLALAVLYGVGILISLTALYLILEPVGRGPALFAALARLVYLLLWFVMLLNFFSALRLMGNGKYLQVFESERLHALAGMQLASGWGAYYLGLTFYGLGTFLFTYLWFKSRYIPRSLAIWGLLSSLFEGFCAFAYLVNPRFGNVVSVNWYELPIAIFEIATAIWLLAKGLRAPVTAARVHAAN